MEELIKNLYVNSGKLSLKMSDIHYLSKTITTAQNFCNENNDQSDFLITALEILEYKLKNISNKFQDSELDILKLKNEYEKQIPS